MRHAYAWCFSVFFLTLRRITMNQAQSTQEKQYFDLHTTGIGYLNRIRVVSPKKGQPFLACNIAALSGAADDVVYTRFDCRVSGKEAEALVRQYEDAVKQDQKVRSEERRVGRECRS